MPTLKRPDIVISERSTANSGSETSRPSSHIYVKTFVNESGDRIYHFTSVTVDQDGKEVSISNQEKRPNRIINLLQNGRLIWTNPEKFEKEVLSASDTQKEDAVLPMDSQSATQTAFTDSLGFDSKTSGGKGNALPSDKQAERTESLKRDSAGMREFLEELKGVTAWSEDLKMDVSTRTAPGEELMGYLHRPLIPEAANRVIDRGGQNEPTTLGEMI